MRRSIEVHEITRTHVHGPKTQPRFAGIYTLEVDETLERAFQQLRVVEARRLEGAVGVEPRGRLAQREKSSGPGKHGPIGAHLVEEVARVVIPGKITEGIA